MELSRYHSRFGRGSGVFVVAGVPEIPPLMPTNAMPEDSQNPSDHHPVAPVLRDTSPAPALPPPDTEVVAALPDPTAGSVDPDRLGLPAAMTVQNGVRKLARRPETVILDILTAHNGPLTQAELTRRTGLSSTAFRDALSVLEDNDEIRKIQSGRTNMVYLADALPEPEFGADESIPRRP